MKKIVLISCVKSKLPGKHKACKLYNSTLFKYQLAYAKKLTDVNNVYILSSKYGLVELEQVLESYELTLNNMRERDKKEWANRVHKQMKNKGINKQDRIVFLAGDSYTKYLKIIYKNNEFPLGKMPFGERLRFLKNQIKE